MKQDLRARFERLGPVHSVERVSSGSPGALILRLAKGTRLNLIEATRALAKRGVKVASAKRAIETMVEKGEVIVVVPMVENLKTLGNDLRKAGVLPHRVSHDRVDVKALRTSLAMTQEEFAARYGLNRRNVEKWEAGKPISPTANAYLLVIQREPDAAAAALEREIA
jgi:DNA-binding transcriptional regulator YiaG